jgi:ribonuclease BN (tRNA processing enzyme)
MVELVILGSGGGYVSERRACASFIFGNKLIDCGFGSLSNFRKLGLELDQIEEIYISHLHADHYWDFVSFLWAMALEERTKPLTVISSESVRRALKAAFRLSALPKQAIKFMVLFKAPNELGVKFVRGIHKPESFAYKISFDGVTIVYSGDTAPSQAIADLAAGGDLLIHEATFLYRHAEYAHKVNHSTAEEVARMASDINIKKLVLTHFSPVEDDEKEYIEEASKYYDGELIIAKDLLEVSITSDRFEKESRNLFG